MEEWEEEGEKKKKKKKTTTTKQVSINRLICMSVNVMQLVEMNNLCI